MFLLKQKLSTKMDIFAWMIQIKNFREVPRGLSEKYTNIDCS